MFLSPRKRLVIQEGKSVINIVGARGENHISPITALFDVYRAIKNSHQKRHPFSFQNANQDPGSPTATPHTFRHPSGYSHHGVLAAWSSENGDCPSFLQSVILPTLPRPPCLGSRLALLVASSMIWFRLLDRLCLCFFSLA